VLGRISADCHIVIVDRSVSKRHARVYRDDETYFIEDLNSRNHTFLNGVRLSPHVPRPLKPDDEIRICNYVMQYCPDEEPVAVVHSQEFLVNPADRLRALLSVGSAGSGSGNLGPLLSHVADTLFDTRASQVLDVDELLGQAAETLLGLFGQADRCFVLLHDEYGRPQPRASRCRRPDAGEGRPSRGVVRQTLDSMRSHLFVNRPGSACAEPRSVMCVPLATSEGRAFGAVQLETRDRTQAFAPEDLGLLGVVASLAGVAIERVRLQAKAREQALAHSEIELAREVQLGFLPQALPAIDGYEFYAHYSPAMGVGGDFYDFIPLPGGRLAVVLGDVAGHGVSAALLVAKLSSAVRFCLLSEPDPARAVTLLNDQMIRGGAAGKFITVVVMVLDHDAHRLTVVNAGHTLPKIYSSATGTLADLIPVEKSDLVIGVEPGYEYSATTVSLDPGETVTAYTDGVTDALDPASAPFGLRALEASLTPPVSAGPTAARPRRVGEALVGAVRLHANGRHQFDDLAVVCFGRWEPSAESSSTLNGKTIGPGSPRG
ncbi:MAG TPA: SpoIIE family protein phosphatase, partial [Gemmata sp.]|nr:SpoIIE family protein phosphatase [Gemmata sp.]